MHEPLGHLHLNHTFIDPCIVIFLTAMEVVLRNGHRLNDGVKFLYLVEVLHITILVLQSRIMAIQTRVYFKSVGHIIHILVKV